MSTFTARLPTPIFNTPDIPFSRTPLKKDPQGLIRETESIAFPGTKFQHVRYISEDILEIQTTEYSSTSPLYVDRRFLEECLPEAKEREKNLPSSRAIQQWLEGSVGTRYFWGGNWREGIPHMLDFYSALRETSQEDRDDAICRGVDCSGLLYQATHGITPRNTSQLIDYGQDLPFHNLSPSELKRSLQPLDLIVWRGHVLIVLSSQRFIESREKDGVVISNLQQRYAEVLALTQKQQKTLYFRRWHPEVLR